jgi:TPR repeat protein
MDGVRKCRFTPATVDGRAVETWQGLQYVWTLEETTEEEEAAMDALRRNDLAAAAALLRKAALNGSVEAQYYLGRLLYFGNDGARNPVVAVAWLEKAAGRGHVQAQGTLGAILLAQGGADARAYELIRRAARSGDGASMYWLGLCLAYGRGTAQDMPQAMLWYQQAAASGHAKAQQALADLERQGIKPPR